MTKQTDLFDPKARLRDPATSKEAGLRHVPASSRTALQRRILRALSVMGPMTDKDLAAVVWQMEDELEIKRSSPSGIRSRRNELVTDGLVEDSGTKARIEGYNCTVWRASAKAGSLVQGAAHGGPPYVR